MKSTLALLLAASGAPALGSVCGGNANALAVGVLQLCTYESFQNEMCSYTGTIWDSNCKTLTQTKEDSNEAKAICDGYNNDYGVTCASGSSSVIKATKSGKGYTCTKDTGNEKCGSALYGSANIQVCCTPN